MRETVIPSLTAGWVTDPPQKLNAMFAHALISDYSQSTIYFGNITSIPYLVANHQNSQADMANELETAMHVYLSRVFSIVDVQVAYTPVIDNKYQLNISINITENNNVFSLSSAIDVDNGIIRKVVAELNQ